MDTQRVVIISECTFTGQAIEQVLGELSVPSIVHTVGVDARQYEQVLLAVPSVDVVLIVLTGGVRQKFYRLLLLMSRVHRIQPGCRTVLVTSLSEHCLSYLATSGLFGVTVVFPASVSVACISVCLHDLLAHRPLALGVPG
ncbi:hypothetical protein [Budvicia aquatica]|uniref:Uncharacterized protein n=1 Tax=Budvicia aquatica TaxID=82979 RepID=A0A2C6DTT4_9GAMM|nr:hypothetical protein [Budvicia aquatica]PHI32231.1 hypothetical protein CRN84_24385 [Budvicia aquatica]